MKTPRVIPIKAKAVLDLARDAENVLFMLFSQSWIDDSRNESLQRHCAQLSNSIARVRADVDRGRAVARERLRKEDAHASSPA